jgi:hypothetical protein
MILTSSTDPGGLVGEPRSIIPLRLDKASRELINQAVPNAVSIQVAELDKGLSGATVWLTEWSMKHGVRSAPHVMKIDAFKKLSDEKRRVDEYVAGVDPATGHIALFGPVDADTSGEPERGLLRQAYIGASQTGPISLRAWIRQFTDGGLRLSSEAIERAQKAVRAKVSQLYTKRMQLWYEASRAAGAYSEGSIAQELTRRMRHRDKLTAMVQTLGSIGIAQSLEQRRLASYEETHETIGRLLERHDQFPYGLIHGDLHSQNVLIHNDDQIHLIDFAWAGYGWRALDFLMLECSLKFLVAPNDAGIDDLLEAERLLDERTGEHETFQELDSRICGAELRIITAAVAEIRRLAHALSAVRDQDQYRRGLIAMSAMLGGFPQLHRSFLIHSLCYHVSRFR